MEGLDVVPANQFMNRPFADVTGGQLRADIADGHVRHADVGAEQREERFVRLAGIEEFQPRNAETVLKDLGVVAR